MSEWKEVKIDDISSILGDGLHGTPIYNENGQYYFINGNNLENGNIVIKKDTKRVGEEEYQKYKKDLNDRTLFVSINGTVGNIAKYAGEQCILGKSACYFNVIENVNRDFIYYIIASPRFQNAISGLATGTTIKNVSLKTMREYSFMLPDLPTQQRIASILSSLDAKIENNNKTNAKLEEIAQNLFKEWFVDFGPFKNGKFVESELGLIPEGWRVGTLGEILDIKYGKDHKKLEEGNIPVYGSGGLMRFANKFLYDKESVLIPRKGTLNNIMYVTEPFWTVDTMFYSEIKIPNSGIFTYQFLSKKDMNQLNSGTSIPSMTTEILNKQKLVIPSDKTFFDYNSIVKSLYERIKHNELESIKISNLRDTLLPKLMSGEIEV